MAERLQKFLSRAGVASRRKAEALIAAGAVTVNGVRAELGQSVTPGDDVRVNGVRAAVQEHVTFLLYKPAGVLSSVSDDRGRETVIDLLPPVPGLHPVGRLDLESEGLLLVTNDGDLTLRLTHPRYGHEKAYRVWCDAPLSRTDLQRLKNGLELDDGPAKAAAVRAVGGRELLDRTERAAPERAAVPFDADQHTVHRGGQRGAVRLGVGNDRKPARGLPVPAVRRQGAHGQLTVGGDRREPGARAAVERQRR